MNGESLSGRAGWRKAPSAAGDEVGHRARDRESCGRARGGPSSLSRIVIAYRGPPSSLQLSWPLSGLEWPLLFPVSLFVFSSV